MNKISLAIFILAFSQIGCKTLNTYHAEDEFQKKEESGASLIVDMKIDSFRTKNWQIEGELENLDNYETHKFEYTLKKDKEFREKVFIGLKPGKYKLKKLVMAVPSHMVGTWVYSEFDASFSNIRKSKPILVAKGDIGYLGGIGFRFKEKFKKNSIDNIISGNQMGFIPNTVSEEAFDFSH